MVDSNLVFEKGDAVDEGNPVQNNFVYSEGTLVSDGDVSELSFVEGRGLGIGAVVFYTDNSTIYELNYDDFSVKRSQSVGFSAHGIGGDANVVWVGDDETDEVRKLNYSDFSLIETGSLPVPSDERVSDVGGSQDSLYVITDKDGASPPGAGRIWVVDPDTYSIETEINLSDGGGTEAGGAGGTANVYWQANYEQDQDPSPSTLHERDTDTAASLRSSDVGITQVIGAGGSDAQIYLASNSVGKIYEVDPSDFSVLRSASVPNLPAYGCGGM